MRWLNSNEKFDPCYMRHMKVPISSFGDHSIILNKYIKTPVHLILFWPKTRKKYYCGWITAQPTRIMLLSDIKQDTSLDNVSIEMEKRPPEEISYNILNMWVVNRCKYQDKPDCQTLKQEWVARWIIFNIVHNKDTWLNKEKERILMLKEEFDLVNIKKIYPEINSMETAVNDMIQLYVHHPYKMNTSNMENILGWLDEYFE